MKMTKPVLKLTLAAAVLCTLPACTGLGAGESGISSYRIARVARTQVADGSMSVAPPRPWNRYRSMFWDDIRQTEDWTLNGPYLDGISFVAGLRNGQYLIRQQRTDSQQVPKFRSEMTAPEIAAMLESLFRVRGGAVEFRTLGIQPRPFLGTNGWQFDYEHLDSDELWRKGRVVGTTINGRLYMILIDAARSHYYNDTVPDFEAIVASARYRR